VSQVSSLTGVECVDALRRHGYEVTGGKGVHQLLAHPSGKTAIVPVSVGEKLSRGLLRNILAATGLTPAELVAVAASDNASEGLEIPENHPLRSVMPKVLNRIAFGKAMSSLVAPAEPSRDIASIASEAAVRQPALIQAAIWYYVDDLDRSHNIAQNIEGPEGAFWHGLMHRREGDFWNAKYWFRRAGALPSKLGLEPIVLTDKVAALKSGDNPPDLLDAQRVEWLRLVEHCLEPKQ